MIAKADETERGAAERLRRMRLALEGRARRLANGCANAAYWVGVLMLLLGALALIIGHPFHSGWAGLTVAAAVILFIVLETFGVLHHARELRDELEARLAQKFGRWLGLAQFPEEVDISTYGPSGL